MQRFIYDIDRKIFRTASDMVRAGYCPSLSYGERAVWQIRLVASDSDAIDLSGVSGWRAAVDTDFTAGTTPMARTTGGIAVDTSGDWPVATVPIDTLTERFQQVCDGHKSTTAYFELAGLDGNGDTAFYVCFQINALYPIDPQAAGTVPPVAATELTEAQVRAIAQDAASQAAAPDLTNYYTKPQADSLLSGRAASADLASEASARQSADAALDTRVSALEQSGGGSAPDLTNYYTKDQADALLAVKANAAHAHVQADVAGLADALAAKANAAHTHDQADVAGLAAALAAKQDALPAGATGLYLQKTASGVRWADVTATDYDPLHDRRVVSPVEIDGIESTLRSLIEEMPHMCPKTIVVTHDCGDSEPAYPAGRTDAATGLQLGHTYQLTLWGGNGNYDGYGHATPSGTPGPSDGYVTGTRLVLPSSFGAAAGTYYPTDGVWTRPASGTTPAYYIGNSGWTAWAFSGWYAGPDTDVATAYQTDSDCIEDGPYYSVASYSWSPSADGATVMAAALATAVEEYGEDYSRPLDPSDNGIEDNVIIGLVYWATYLDITPCVAGTCPLEARIAALEGGSEPAGLTCATTVSGYSGTYAPTSLTTTYNGQQYPVYYNGSKYLAMRSNGRPALNASTDVSSQGGYYPQSWPALGAPMTPENLTGTWYSGQDDWEDTFTWTYA